MIQIHHKYSLKRQNSFGLDVSTQKFLQLSNNDSYTEFFSSDLRKESPLFILGGGSNVLFMNDFEGLIVKPNNVNFEILDDNSSNVRIKVGAGMVWDDLVAACVANKWYGIENLSDIPGNVGSAPIQNIGAYGTEVKETIEHVEGYEVESGKFAELTKADCEFGYRNSIFKNELKGKFLISDVVFKLSKKEDLNLSYGKVKEEYQKHGASGIAALRQTIKCIRREKLPIYEQLGNAGSFFKNPIVNSDIFKNLKDEYRNIPGFEQNNGFKIPAAWLIENTGLKGFEKGNVATHLHQPLVIINKGNASGREIFDFSEMIIEKVNSKFDIRLEREVNVI